MAYDVTGGATAHLPSPFCSQYSPERLAHNLIRRIRGEDPRKLRELERAEFRSGGSMGPAPCLKTLDYNQGERTE